MSRYFTVLVEITRRYRRFITKGREPTVWMAAPTKASASPCAAFCQQCGQTKYSLHDLARGRRRKERSLSLLAHLKRSIVEVNAEENCLAHALVIAWPNL